MRRWRFALPLFAMAMTACITTKLPKDGEVRYVSIPACQMEMASEGEWINTGNGPITCEEMKERVAEALLKLGVPKDKIIEMSK